MIANNSSRILSILAVTLVFAFALPAEALKRATTPAGQVSTEDFLQSQRMRELRISAGGSYFALFYQSPGGFALAVVHRESQTLTKITTIPNRAYIDYEWASDNSIVVTRSTPSNGYEVSWTRFEYDSDRKRVRVDTHPFARGGTLIDPLPQKPNKILFGNSARVWELDLRKLKSNVGNPWSKQVARHRESVRHWVTDANGEVRAALTRRKGESLGDDLYENISEVWFRAPGVTGWTLVAATKEEEHTSLLPLGFTPDGSRLLLSSNQDRDRSALLEVDPESGKTTRTIYEHPTGEIVDIVWAPRQREILGVGVYVGGRNVYHYFAGAYKKHTADLAAVLPGVSTRIQSVSQDETILAISAKAPTTTARLYVVDVAARTALDIGSVAPWLDGVSLAVPHRFTVRAEGGPEVEAFYTASESAGARPPLVVMPHGGPIGARDDVSFNAMAQLLAHRGYAVLQVNYRGSSGFGRSFLEAGLAEWGKGIELDIDAALAHVLEQGWVDPDRVAIFGWSYGGYSALMSVVLYPERYRCAASMAGVTDIPLRFDTPRAKASPNFRRILVRIMGDPDSDFEDMKRRSPVYRAADIHVPILLIQGARDDRVDVEHAYRMKLMLEKHEVPHSTLILRDADHFNRPSPEQAEWFDKLLYFLETNLEPREAVAAD